MALVRRDYSDPSRLEERFRAWREYHVPDLLEIVLRAVAEQSPRQVLEAGCGDGRFSARIRDELGARVVALDVAPGMAALAALRGLDVQVGDIRTLPWPDQLFDTVVANWMLYHVPDLSAGLREVRRVLAPGGRLVATTMGHGHMRELWDLVGDGDAAPELPFSAENGAEVLAAHFEEVEVRPMAGHAVFPDYEAAAAHVRASLTRAHLVDRLPRFSGPLRVSTSNTMFIGTRAIA